MPQNFIAVDRDQVLLPPSLRDWLPDGHFAWFVLEAVEEMDLLEAGLLEVGVLAIDGTRVHANAGRDANTKYEEIAKEILAEAGEVIARRTSASATVRAWMCCRRVSYSGRTQGVAARSEPPAGGAARGRGAPDPQVAP